MKKLLLSLLLVAGLATSASSQDIQKTIGVRLGWGGEFSYQHPLSSNTRMEFDLGLYGFNKDYSSVFLSGIYQWVTPIQDGFNWYVGVGPQLGFTSYRNDYKKGDKAYVSGDTNFELAVAGQLGVEYNFPSVPFQISLDWRPGFEIVPTTGFMYEGFALGLRYRF